MLTNNLLDFIYNILFYIPVADWMLVLISATVGIFLYESSLSDDKFVLKNFNSLPKI